MTSKASKLILDPGMPWEVATLPKLPAALDYEASSSDLALLDGAMIPGQVKSLRCTGKLIKRGAALSFQGVMAALVNVECASSLRAFDLTVEEPLNILFATVDGRSPERELVVDVEDVDLEVIEDGRIDLWDLLMQYLALAVPRFPRHPELPDLETGTETPVTPTDREAKNTPFADLKELLIKGS